MRLSNFQLVALEDIAAAEAMGLTPGSGKLYVEAFTETLRYHFNTYGERERWLENLESRGLITIDRGMFLRLTEKSREFLKTAKKATRRDFAKEGAERERREEAEAATTSPTDD